MGRPEINPSLSRSRSVYEPTSTAEMARRRGKRRRSKKQQKNSSFGELVEHFDCGRGGSRKCAPCERRKRGNTEGSPHESCRDRREGERAKGRSMGRRRRRSHQERLVGGAVCRYPRYTPKRTYMNKDSTYESTTPPRDGARLPCCLLPPCRRCFFCYIYLTCWWLPGGGI